MFGRDRAAGSVTQQVSKWRKPSSLVISARIARSSPNGAAEPMSAAKGPFVNCARRSRGIIHWSAMLSYRFRRRYSHPARCRKFHRWTVTFGLWRRGSRCGIIPLVANQLRHQHHGIFCLAALIAWIAWGWPALEALMTGATFRGSPVPVHWLVPFALFGATALGTMVLSLPRTVHWTLLGLQLASVVTMTMIVPWAGMSEFLIIIAWQAAMLTTPAKALSWVAFQTLVMMGALAQTLTLDLCWVIGESVALQLLLVFTAQALRREAKAARALAETNRELRAAQAIIANTARDAERLRISRELHDAWGHELTALGLQLEIASQVTEPGRGNDHVVQAKGLARALLAKVRDVVATLRDAERCDLKVALESLAQSVPIPAVHVDISSEVRVDPDQAHALIRCAQEAVTNAVRHSEAANLWLQVTSDGEGVRLIARDDGSARPVASSPGCGLVGMRERLEHLGGRLAVRTGIDLGFTVDAWLPSRASKAV
ncbi:sensor histidine kinase [Sphingosinicella sp. CPCC 101087]|uniref:sensor histidine kinase n=1 Tax=Sphingosinicella sp. CPCC 101087 TaxID=2497754 RepID=UPI00197E3925|nr:sensor histidine kinase [Sphingosinicella sp. CPCC 101087]